MRLTVASKRRDGFTLYALDLLYADGRDLLEPADYLQWLDSPKDEAAELFGQYAGSLRTYPAPRPPPKPRAPRLTSKAPVK